MKLLKINSIKEESLFRLDLNTLLMTLGTTTVLNTASDVLVKKFISKCTNKFIKTVIMPTNNDLFHKSLNYLFLLNPKGYGFEIESYYTKYLSKDQLTSLSHNNSYITTPREGNYIISLTDSFIYWSYESKGNKSMYMNQENTMEIEKEYELKIYFVGLSAASHYERYLEFLDRKPQDKKQTKKELMAMDLTIYSSSSACRNIEIDTMAQKTWNSMIFDKRDKEEIISSIDTFLDSREKFKSNEWQYNFNILFTGFAGTGKTSISKIIACYVWYKQYKEYYNNISTDKQSLNTLSPILHGRNFGRGNQKTMSLVPVLFVINAKSFESDYRELKKQMNNTLNTTIIVVEEVDEIMKDDDSRTFFQQFLDGPYTPDNAIIICTTNYTSKLDYRLYERFHFVKEIKPLSRNQAIILAKKHGFDESILEGEERYIPEYIVKRLKEFGVKTTLKEKLDMDKLMTKKQVTDYWLSIPGIDNNKPSLEQLLYKQDVYVARLLEHKIRLESTDFIKNNKFKDDKNDDEIISLSKDNIQNSSTLPSLPLPLYRTSNPAHNYN